MDFQTDNSQKWSDLKQGWYFSRPERTETRYHYPHYYAPQYLAHSVRRR